MQTIERALPIWQARTRDGQLIEGVRVKAGSRSEARGLLKRHLGVPRLPAGMSVERVAEGLEVPRQ
jgi:hypothetical protein